MTRDECKNKIVQFKIAVENYRRTIPRDQDSLVTQVGRNNHLDILRSQLNQKYGGCEKCINYLNPIGRDMGQIYLSAFSDKQFGDSTRDLDAVVQDIDRTIGRYNDITEAQFKTILRSQPGTYAVHHITNFHSQYWRKIASGIWSWITGNILATVISGLVLAGVIYALGWN
jgi:hypothetical protein